MLLKSQEIVIKNKDFFKEKIILLYGENQDLINDLNQQIVSKFIQEKKISKSFFEEDIIKNPENIINYYLNGSLFDDNKNISIIKDCSDKILEIINKIKNNINNNVIILNSEILLKNSKLRQFGEYDKLAICIPCYQETKFDIKKFLIQQLQTNNIQLPDSQNETIINSSSLKRSKIKEVIDALKPLMTKDTKLMFTTCFTGISYRKIVEMSEYLDGIEVSAIRGEYKTNVPMTRCSCKEKGYSDYIVSKLPLSKNGMRYDENKIADLVRRDLGEEINWVSAGMAYEAMNNAGASKTKMIVVLHDNDMSIAKPVGAMRTYLAKLLTGKIYFSLRL